MTSSLRDYISKFVTEEFVGPGSPMMMSPFVEGFDIPFRERPRSRYGAGILFPRKTASQTQEQLVVEGEAEAATAAAGAVHNKVDIQEADNKIGAGGETEADLDHDMRLANEYLPSAMGLSVLADITRNYTISVSGATYVKDSNWQREGKINRQWRRRPFVDSILVTSKELQQKKAIKKKINTVEDVEGLCVKIFGRSCELPDGDAGWIITFTLINDKITDGGRPKDEDCYYQCSMEIASEGPGGFLEYPESGHLGDQTEEVEDLALLYRHRKIFAVGHGCSADWAAGDGDVTCSKVYARVLPEYEVYPVRPWKSDELNLDIWHLATCSDQELITTCRNLAEHYYEWIEAVTGEASQLEGKYSAAAKRNISKCRKCLDRITTGINMLSNDSEALRAFRLMSRSMYMQSYHYDLSSKNVREWDQSGKLSGEYVSPDYQSLSKNPKTKREWRPFQLAFILMSLSSVTDLNSSERDLVDLIWFPTGGGKTEAYLGLAAYSIFLRRLKNKNNIGTSVLMRYTLRLLTAQQFQRAASLICAMELLRRKQPQLLGASPITIGLWVGSKVTPNKKKEALSALNELKNGGGNPFILTACPWCGSQMGHIKKLSKIKGYRADAQGWVRHYCDDPACELSDGSPLPVSVIDEDIYNSPPSMLIATVDKFASLPWLTEPKSLFGLGDNQRNDPPDLIIQDELHLISGPLGSMVGHYETVIDILASRERNGRLIRPKIIASTATISNANTQIRKLYGREAELFPPQGLKAGDSFFAFEDKNSPGRKYVGIFATGLPSQMTTMVRLMSVLTQAPAMAEADAQAKDYYWTQLVYFNSIRELGHAYTLVRSDVREYIRVLVNMRMHMLRDDPRSRMRINSRELTSRISSDLVKETLDDLFKEHHKTPQEVIDICLATNMIQVGLDVSRLSLMVIAGQPKTTSEYIQASSRVGRSQNAPGIVFTVLNPAKPRDRSHYEQFRSYHQSFYRYVEPTSVTPFSVPVRERALHALIITLIRYLAKGDIINSPEAVIPDELWLSVTDKILSRVSLIEPDELDNTKRMIEDIRKDWKNCHADEYGKMYLSGTDDQTYLMIPSSANIEDNGSFSTPTSMRNVDVTCKASFISSYD